MMFQRTNDSTNLKVNFIKKLNDYYKACICFYMIGNVVDKRFSQNLET